jgi:excisionase family DNA binding protein
MIAPNPRALLTNERMLTVDDAAKQYRICAKEVRKLIRGEVLPAARVGKGWLVHPQDARDILLSEAVRL